MSDEIQRAADHGRGPPRNDENSPQRGRPPADVTFSADIEVFGRQVADPMRRIFGTAGSHQSPFEQIRRTNDAGMEYWSSRDFAEVLGYGDYRNFEGVVEKAKLSCFNSGHRIGDHFVDVTEMIEIGKGGRRSVKTLLLAIFQNHGYMGLYGGLKQEDIPRRKGLKKSQKILDHMGSTELAANLFRATQAGEKWRRDQVRGKDAANRTHYEVGAKVRQTIKELGGTMPEELPAAESVKRIEAKQRRQIGNVGTPAIAEGK